MKPTKIYLSSPHLGAEELKFVHDAFATNWIAPLGPHVDAFEREFCWILQEVTEATEKSTASVSSVPSCSTPALHAAALASGTAALHLALKLVGVKQDDEVFCSTLTFSASANPIVYEGGRSVFLDSERTSWNMDPALLAEALADRARRGKLPRAVIVVHLYGQCADLAPIAALCDQYGVALIEDAAEALGAVYFPTKPDQQELTEKTEKAADPTRSSVTSVTSCSKLGIAPGTVGRLGIFSFNGNKIITTSGGGMLVSREEALISKARFWATQARDPAPHYQHSEIGYNYRLSNVLAGIGRGQLRVLADRVNARRANCAFYQQAFADLPGISFMPEAPWNRSNRWLTCIQVDPQAFGADREAIRLALERENIEARPVWKPMHLQPVFAHCDCFGGAVAEELFDRGLCLPSGSNLTEGDLERVVRVVRGLKA
ncbi:MAG: pyridoxal phosphate-dependent aminotransferase [Verrucomicrobia bacterium]|nr:pyridoxal phosphate-dependent aminotransferase [Verrucomicrobiota bacterium]